MVTRENGTGIRCPYCSALIGAVEANPGYCSGCEALIEVPNDNPLLKDLTKKAGGLASKVASKAASKAAAKASETVSRLTEGRVAKVQRMLDKQTDGATVKYTGKNRMTIFGKDGAAKLVMETSSGGWFAESARGGWISSGSPKVERVVQDALDSSWI